VNANYVPARSGFTLIEILVVILIIGILAGLLLPAVMQAVRTAQETAYKLEVDALADAVEKYHNKYGDYPPDGSSWQVMERHLRKAFPQILASELSLLDPSASAALLTYQGWSGNPWNANLMASIVAGVRNDFDQGVTGPTYFAADFKVMDPAEALVFFLGGFSSNPQRPFTGVGGPFVVTVGAPGSAPPATGLGGGQTLQYNVQRSNSMFEFKVDRLTVSPEAVGGVTVNISNDEQEFLNAAAANDLLPVYLGRNDLSRSAPFVYFDSRTYVFSKMANPMSPNLYANFYQRAPTVGTLASNESRFGAIRPLVSDTVRTPPVLPVTSRTPFDWFRTNLFMDDKKFQVIGPGMDDIYGGYMAQDLSVSGITLYDRLAAYWTFPSGNSYIPGTAPGTINRCTRLLLPPSLKGTPEYIRSSGIADNSASCTERTFNTTLTVP